MRRVALRPIAALLMGLAALPAEAFGPPQLAYRSGNYRIAASALQDALEEAPEDSELHARLGITYALMGDFVDALPHFEASEGSLTYEAEAWSHHADTLRALGYAEDAYNMRLERLPLLPGDANQAATRCDMVDDLRAMGALDEAVALSELTLALHPYAEVARAQRLDLALDRGDADADAIVAWMERSERLPPRALQALARVALDEGDVPGALAQLERIPRQHRLSAPVIAQQAELLRLNGELVEALWTLDRPMVRTPKHPALLAIRARVLAELGRAAEAREVCGQAMSQYPYHPEVLATSRQLGCP